MSRLRVCNLLPNELNELFTRQGEIVFRCDGFAELNFHFTNATKGMKAAGLGGDQLHVRHEHGNDGQAGFLGDVINAGLTGGNIHPVTARAFGKHDEMKLAAGAAESLEFIDAIGIHLAAFKEEADAAAEKFLQP